MKKLVQLIALAVILAGTQTGCRTVAPGGVYQSDKTLYAAEAAIVTSYQVVQTFLAWESANRDLLKSWPAITPAADQMRLKFPPAYHTANALRDAYIADPTDPNRAALSRSLAVLRAALAEASKYMIQATQTP